MESISIISHYSRDIMIPPPLRPLHLRSFLRVSAESPRSFSFRREGNCITIFVQKSASAEAHSGCLCSLLAAAAAVAKRRSRRCCQAMTEGCNGTVILLMWVGRGMLGDLNG